MHYTLINTPEITGSDCLVIGLRQPGGLPEWISALPPEGRERITRLKNRLANKTDMLVQSDFEGKSLLLMQCGDDKGFSVRDLDSRLADVVAFVTKQRMQSVTICLPLVDGRDADWQVSRAVTRLQALLYQMLDFKTVSPKPHALQSLSLFQPGAHQEALTFALAAGKGMAHARTLANLPANVCTPARLGEEALKLSAEYESVTATLHEQADLEAMGMGALLAVGRGSAEPPVLVELHYRGNGDAPPVVLVGKGITFDSGGISIKPAAGMEEMKFDMSGAASVLGTLRACAELGLRVNVIGLLACAENMPGGRAIKPGDIVTSMSGQTIEITNTDAEGRLVLADALTYAERFHPAFVLDIATLTGAMVIALGHQITGFMTPDDALADRIARAASESGDRAWRLPMDEDYGDVMDSPIADMQNSASDRAAGSITAACFLSRFTKKYPWAHLDIAGTAWVSGKSRDATGRPVPLLLEVLRDVATTG